MVLSNCTFCGTKKLGFIKEQKASERLSNLRLKIPLTKISLVDFFFVLEVLTS